MLTSGSGTGTMLACCLAAAGPGAAAGSCGTAPLVACCGRITMMTGPLWRCAARARSCWDSSDGTAPCRRAGTAQVVMSCICVACEMQTCIRACKQCMCMRAHALHAAHLLRRDAEVGEAAARVAVAAGAQVQPCRRRRRLHEAARHAVAAGRQHLELEDAALVLPALSVAPKHAQQRLPVAVCQAAQLLVRPQPQRLHVVADGLRSHARTVT